MSAIFLTLCLALSVIAYALMPRHTRRHAPVRGHWDEDAQRWTTTPVPGAAPTPAPALIDLGPGIDLSLHDHCVRLWAMPAHRRAADHTTTSEGDQ